jgi:hypothetical protein
MSLSFKHTDCVVSISHAYWPEHVTGPVAGINGRTCFHGTSAHVWISADLPYLSPAFYGVLVHELVHLAGAMLCAAGDTSRDPLGENLPELVEDLTVAVMGKLPAMDCIAASGGDAEEF